MVCPCSFDGSAPQTAGLFPGAPVRPWVRPESGFQPLASAFNISLFCSHTHGRGSCNGFLCLHFQVIFAAQFLGSALLLPLAYKQPFLRLQPRMMFCAAVKIPPQHEMPVDHPDSWQWHLEGGELHRSPQDDFSLKDGGSIPEQHFQSWISRRRFLLTSAWISPLAWTFEVHYPYWQQFALP